MSSSVRSHFALFVWLQFHFALRFLVDPLSPAESVFRHRVVGRLVYTFVLPRGSLSGTGEGRAGSSLCLWSVQEGRGSGHVCPCVHRLGEASSCFIFSECVFFLLQQLPARSPYETVCRGWRQGFHPPLLSLCRAPAVTQSHPSHMYPSWGPTTGPVHLDLDPGQHSILSPGQSPAGSKDQGPEIQDGDCQANTLESVQTPNSRQRAPSSL